MAARGRKSAASLSVASSVPGQRPAPPKELTKFQKAEWKAIVDRMPADWFTRENLPLLAQYVRHVENANRLAAAVDNFDLPLDNMGAAETFDKLTKMLEREGRAMSSLATRLRLTQQTRTLPTPVTRRTRSSTSRCPARPLWRSGRRRR